MKRAGFAICIVISAQLAHGQATALGNPRVPSGPTFQPASLSGSVVNTVTGEPVKKARVTLQVNSTRGGFQGPTSTQTDLSGRFTFTQLPPGSYAVRAEHPNYPQRMGNMGFDNFATAALNEGQSKSDLVIKLTPGSAITGRITNQDGEPMSGCFVQLMQRSSENGRPVMGAMNGTSTNERGEYRLFNIPSGRYYLQARCTRTIPQPFTLRPRDGVVPQGASYPTLFYPNSLSQEGAARIAVEPGTDMQGIDFRIAPIRSTTVAGRIVFPDGFSGQAHAFVTLFRRNANGDVDQAAASSTGARPQNGTFQLMNVAPGSYWLQAGTNTPETTLYAREMLEVGENPIVDLTIRLKSALELRATVETDKAPQPVQAQASVPPPPIEQNFWINPLERYMQMGSAQIRKDPDGSYLIQRLMPGKWEIQTSMGYVKSVRIGDRETEGGVIEITGNESGAMKIVVSQRMGLVSATIPGAAPGKQVSAVLLPEGYVGMHGNRVHHLMVSPTGPVPTSVMPGRYRAIAIDGGNAYQLNDPALEKFVAKHAQSVTVQVDGQVSVVVPLVSREAVEQALRESEEQP